MSTFCKTEPMTKTTERMLKQYNDINIRINLLFCEKNKFYKTKKLLKSLKVLIIFEVRKAKKN